MIRHSNQSNRIRSITSMEVHNQQNPNLYHEEEEEDDVDENYSETGGSDSDWDIEETQGRLSNLSIKKKSISRIYKELDDGVFRRDPEKVEEEVDEKGIDEVQKIIQAGKIEKLKIEQCKVYLRKNGLRLTGNKETFVLRIKEHQEILNGGGEKKYPVSSFVLNCKGDACTGDVVMFEQNVYETYSIVSRSAIGPCGTRIVVGRIVKESYGAAKQQHTFTIEVLWSKGEKPLPPLHPLLIKGRNLYRLKTLRQKWEDEGERQKALMDKHSRGSLARCARESRIQDKHMRKTLRENKSLKKDRNKNKTQSKSSNSNSNQGIQTQQHLCSSVHLQKAAPDPQLSAILMQNSGSYVNIAKQPIEAPKAARHPPVNKNPRTAGENGYPGQRLTSMNNFHTIIPLPGTNVANGFSERYHRQPFASMNNCHPIIPQNRQSYNKQQQQCKFYAQGRCFYGDRCKFLHDQGKNVAAK